MTQGDLGTAAGMDWTSISRLERGEAVPDLATIETLADILDVTIDELVERRHGQQAVVPTESGPVGVILVGTGSGKTEIAALLLAMREAQKRGVTIPQMRGAVSMLPDFTQPKIVDATESRSTEPHDPWEAIAMMQQQIDDLRTTLEQRLSKPEESKPTRRQKAQRTA